MTIERRPQIVFADGVRRVETSFRNLGDKPVTLNLSARLYQASSSTLAPAGDHKRYRDIALASDQIVIEPAEVSIPAVRAETTFILQWRDGEKIVGATIIHAVPTNLLEQLCRLNGGPVGLFDPGGALKPAFSAGQVLSLASTDEFDSYAGKLLISTASASKEQMSGLASALRKKGENGGAVVWMQPPPGRSVEGLPSTYVVNTGAGRVVMTHAPAVSEFGQAPAAQLALVHLAELALGLRKLELPNDSGL